MLSTLGAGVAKSSGGDKVTGASEGALDVPGDLLGASRCDRSLGLGPRSRLANPCGTAPRIPSPAPIPATASSAVETTVRSRRTSRSISSSSSVASVTGGGTAGAVVVRRKNAAARA
ncbi:MAG: hypothetical protein JO325_08810 [Solirubrobacterales bacterium]|nr:hypothetical protein [Solirubrobacterales bacterium]